MTQHHPEQASDRSPSTTTDRCLRHHVWMAACGECRDVRAPLLHGSRRRAGTTR